MFAKIVREGSWVEAVIDLARSESPAAAKARLAPDVRATRARRRVWREQFSVCVWNVRRRYGLGTRGRQSGDREGAPEPSGNERAVCDCCCVRRSNECKLPAGLFALLQGRRHELSAWLVHASANAGRRIHGFAAGRPGTVRPGVAARIADSSLCGDGQRQSGRDFARRHCRNEAMRLPRTWPHRCFWAADSSARSRASCS